jgi:hypothetical protein
MNTDRETHRLSFAAKRLVRTKFLAGLPNPFHVQNFLVDTDTKFLYPYPKIRFLFSDAAVQPMYSESVCMSLHLN